jgi:CubicO group peptidase (beta-lactamase class C family)
LLTISIALAITALLAACTGSSTSGPDGSGPKIGDGPSTGSDGTPAPDGGVVSQTDLGPEVPGACQVSADLDSFISDRMTQTRIPGLAAGLVSAKGLVWSKGYGYADVAAVRGVTKDTIFALMSISKVVSAVGVMQQVEAGKLKLDSDVNDQIKAFDVIHPLFPGVALTTRQLLTHTSGLAGDDYGVLQLNIKMSDADVQPLGEMLASLLTPAGDRYDNGANYSANGPGSAFAYSSIGISLAGFVAESVSGSSFDQLTQASIFDRLGMTNTSWRLSPYQNKWDQVAVMYNYNEAGDTYDPITPFTFADYPAGSIRSSVSDLSKFLAAMINNGTYAGKTIISAATAAEMRQPSDVEPARGLGWSISQGTAGQVLLQHGGDDAGASTNMIYDLDTGRGAILLMNVTRRPETDLIRDRLLEEANACQ